MHNIDFNYKNIQFKCRFPNLISMYLEISSNFKVLIFYALKSLYYNVKYIAMSLRGAKTEKLGSDFLIRFFPKLKYLRLCSGQGVIF